MLTPEEEGLMDEAVAFELAEHELKMKILKIQIKAGGL